MSSETTLAYRVKLAEGAAADELVMDTMGLGEDAVEDGGGGKGIKTMTKEEKRKMKNQERKKAKKHLTIPQMKKNRVAWREENKDEVQRLTDFKLLMRERRLAKEKKRNKQKQKQKQEGEGEGDILKMLWDSITSGGSKDDRCLCLWFHVG